ncbi:MAG: DUF1700 domain-containing protein [Clostridiales bacterium]|nr:DUF1700 domain-containing protein [Clostridiales bacterium]
MMNRADFMKNLAELLADVPLSEREEAIHYYNDYFDDAGEENEQSVIASLGTPEQLARTIKAGLADGENIGEFTEKGFSEYENRNRGEVPDLYRSGEKGGEEKDEKNVADSYYESGQSDGQSNYNNNQNQYSGQGSYNNQNSTDVKPRKSQMSTGTIIIIVILCILASPLLFGIGGGILGIIVGIFGAVLGIVISIGAIAVSLIAVGIALFVSGIAMLLGMPVAGLCLIGMALIFMAIGLVFLWLMVLCGRLVPLVFKGIGKLFSAIFGKGGAKA